MKAVTLTKYIAGLAMVIFTMNMAHAQDAKAQAQTQVEQSTSQQQSSNTRQLVVIKEDGKTATIDMDSETGTIMIRKDENGVSKEVNINLGFLGKSIIAEIAEELDKEGLSGSDPIKIKIDGDDNVVFEKAGKKEVIKRHIDYNNDSDDSNGIQALVAIVAITLIFGMPVFIVIAVMYGRHKRRAMVHESVNKLIDSGQEIPPEIFEEATGAAKDPRKKGIMLVAVGLGLFAFLSAIGDSKVGTIGLIPLMIGLAHIVIWKTDPNRNTEV